MRVLLVDDNTVTLAVTGKQLRDRGHEAHEAACGLDALADLSGWPPDVLVADLIMPGMSGAEVVSRARQHMPGLPVVVTTALPESEIQGVGLPPRTAFLRKPFGVEELEAAMRAAVGGPSDER